MVSSAQQSTRGSPGGSHSLKQIRRLSWLLDSSIRVPGTAYRIGVDPILGLIPGAGDMLASLLSGYIVLLAVGAGASAWTLTRMLGNILLETLVGMVPFVGDLFDAAWKANERNRRLLEDNLQKPTTQKADRLFVVFTLAALLIMAALALTATVVLCSWLLDTLKSSSMPA